MELTAAQAELAPEISWGDFTSRFQWNQGEHLTVVAPTGWGKTTLVKELLRPETRPAQWVVVLSTKRKDSIIDDFSRQGYLELRSFDPVSDPDVTPRIVLAPKITGFNSIDKQREVFRSALDSIFRMGGWTVVLDEMRYITDYLGLRREVEVMLQQGRSAGISVVGGAQRPRHVPLLAFDQARHLFFGYDNDTQNVKRFAEMGGGTDPRTVQEAVSLLESHSMLYVDTEPPATFCRTRVEV